MTYGMMPVKSVTLDWVILHIPPNMSCTTYSGDRSKNPHADDAFLVAKQSFGFLPDERLQGRCQVEVNAGYDYIVIVLAVHVSAYGFGCNKAGTQPGLA